MDIITNIFSDFIFLLLIALIGSGWLWFRRRNLLSLFHVSKQNGLTIYLSRLQIQPNTALGYDGNTKSFSGATVTAAEVAAASALANLFDFVIPGLENQPGILKSIFMRNVSVHIQPSPLSVDSIPKDRTLVAVGSPGFNSVSAWIQQSLDPLIKFSPDNASYLARGQQPFADLTQGMVQVLWDADHARRIFYVAGLSELGTYAAVLYLGRKWGEICKNLGEKDTYACFVRLKDGDPVLLTTIHPN